MSEKGLEAETNSENGLVTKSISAAYGFTDMRPELIPIARFVPSVR